MKIKKILCLLSVIILCFSMFFGCSKNLPENPDNPEIPDTPETPEVKLTSLKIGDRDISEYTIVVGSNPFRFDEEIGYDIPAKAFAKEIYDRLGITLDVEEFSFDAEYGPTIVFGNNYEKKIVRPYYNEYKEIRGKGADGENFIITEKFNIFSVDDAVFFLSGSIPFTERAVESFFNDYIMSFCSSENGDVVLPSDFMFTGADSRSLYTVGCVGDSITEGIGATKKCFCYPSVLQNELGFDDYRIVNFGCGGTTMCTNSTNPYAGRTHYQNLCRYATELDMTIIWLGTNDIGIFGLDGDEEAEKDFLTSYRSMISLLRSANPDMKIILFTPCYGLSEYSVYTLENFINPLISSVAEELGCPVFDMFSYTREMFTEADFSDGVHPLDSGYSIVAEKVAEIVRQYQ